jgi:glycosyltransferase involved in cell wall biosynthesis
MDDLPALYRTAWASALPSWGEAFGLVLAEALASGTPVVGANREAIPEVLGGTPGIGALFDGEDVAPALLETLDLARDPATAARCRARAEHFSVAACAERHEALYAELIRR